MLEFVNSWLYFVPDEHNFINPLLKVGSRSGRLKINGSGSGGPKIHGSNQIRIPGLYYGYLSSSGKFNVHPEGFALVVILKLKNMIILFGRHF